MDTDSAMNKHHLLPVAALLAAFSADLAAQTWTQLLPAPYPTTLARRSGGMAFHPVQGGLVMYGGLQSGPTLTLNDTWSFDGATWTQLTPATTPPPRWGHRMVYDSRRARIVTFGGRSPTTTANANDTWEWDGTDWQQMSPATSPSARAFYSMAYDERRGKTIIYGAMSGSTIGTAGGNQTWEYDGLTWTQVVTPFTPPGLETPAMAYDKGRGVTVMFGGYYGGVPGATMYNLTWEYDGTDWVQRAPTTSPPGRYRAGCVYDESRGRVVVYGGYGAGALLDTWEYDGNDWTQILNAGPAKATEGYMGFLPTLQQAVYFGGSGPGGTNNETWTYYGPTTAIAAQFGQGCAAGGGPVSLTPTTRPVLGTNYVLDVANGTFGGLGVIAHGFSNTVSLFGNLPFDLASFGYSGCRLEVSTETTQVLVLVNGAASQTFHFPNDPAFANLQIYSQVVVLDSTSPNGSGGLSNGVHAVLGL